MFDSKIRTEKPGKYLEMFSLNLLFIQKLTPGLAPADIDFQ